MKFTKLSFLPVSLIILMCVCGFSASSAGEINARIAVMSYNIHHGEGMDGKIDLERIAAVICSASPDVVSLQEVDNGTKRSGGVDEAQELSRLTGMKYVFASSMDFDGGKYGNAVLTKFVVEESKVLPLPGEPRSALFVKLKIPQGDTSGISFTFIATHLDTKAGPRLKALPLIEQQFEQIKNPEAIIAGDLNDTPESQTIRELTTFWSNTTSLDGWYTFPSKVPSGQIDYIMFRPAGRWCVIKTEVLDEAIASDHRAIVSVLELLPDTEAK